MIKILQILLIWSMAAGILFPQDLYQQKRITQLENGLAKTTGIDKITILIDLAKEYYPNFQAKTMDLLHQALQLAEELSYLKGKALVFNAMGNILDIEGKSDQALKYFSGSLEIFEKIKDKTGIAQTLNYLGLAYQALSEYDLALQCYNKSLSLNKNLGNKEGIARSLSNMGVVFDYQGKYSQGLDYYRQSLKIYEEINHKEGISNQLNNMGVIFDSMGEYHQALDFYHRALRVCEEIDNKNGMANGLNNIGVIFKSLGKYDQALQYYHRSLKIKEEINDQYSIAKILNNMGDIYQLLKKYDHALDYYQRSLLKKEEIGNKEGAANTLKNIGNVYQLLGKFELGLQYCFKSLKKSEEIGSKSGMVNALNGLGICYLKLGQLVKAEIYLKKSLVLALEIKQLSMISDNYRNLSELFEIRRNTKKALQYFKLFYEIDKSIFNESSNRQINELQAKYEAEKKEKEIWQLKQNEEIQRLKLSKTKVLRNAFIFGFFLLAIFFVLFFQKYLYLFTFWKKQMYVGRYRLMEKIGSGGMGTVYKAHDIKNKKNKVAVKILNENLFQDADSRKRFKRESEIIDKLEHPHIIRIFERGEDANYCYIIMELLSGRPLSDLIKKNTQLPIRQSMSIMIQISEAIAQIHQRGIIHRDLKPENIMLLQQADNPCFVKLLDFGLARFSDNNPIHRLTQTGDIWGTTQYMSPEHLLSGKTMNGQPVSLSPASDIFSLGIIFYELLTKVTIYSSDRYQAMTEILHYTPPPPIHYNPNLPPELSLIIMRMIDKDPPVRPNANHVLEQLMQIILDLPLSECIPVLESRENQVKEAV